LVNVFLIRSVRKAIEVTHLVSSLRRQIEIIRNLSLFSKVCSKEKKLKMNGCFQFRNIAGLLLVFSSPAWAVEGLADEKAELKLFEGSWTVVKLIEDGEVIPANRISEVLPSGGRIEIVDNSMLFVDVHTGKRHARTITIDPTRYPSTIDIRSADAPEVSRGIYRFDNGQLIVCVGDTFTEIRPAELSAPKGSGAMLMVLQRRTTSADEEKKRNTQPVARPVTPADEDIRKMLPGVWRLPDQLGWLHIRFRENGTFSSYRVHQELQLFRSVFVQVPVSSGSWEVREGRIILNLATTTEPGRAGTSHTFTITGMTSTEFIFYDGLGRSNKATREAPAQR
jgi:uncharacterized protein (TIGR03067 family)